MEAELSALPRWTRPGRPPGRCAPSGPRRAQSPSTCRTTKSLGRPRSPVPAALATASFTVHRRVTHSSGSWPAPGQARSRQGQAGEHGAPGLDHLDVDAGGAPPGGGHRRGAVVGERHPGPGPTADQGAGPAVAVVADPDPAGSGGADPRAAISPRTASLTAMQPRTRPGRARDRGRPTPAPRRPGRPRRRAEHRRRHPWRPYEAVASAPLRHDEAGAVPARRRPLNRRNRH